VVVVGGVTATPSECDLYFIDADGAVAKRTVSSINAYLISGAWVVVEPSSKASDERGNMLKGNMPSDGGHLILSPDEKRAMELADPEVSKFLKGYVGSHDFIHGDGRHCIWISDGEVQEANRFQSIMRRLDGVRAFRAGAKAPTTRPYAAFPHKFRQIQDVAESSTIVIPSHSSENRDYLPVGLLDASTIVSNAALVIYDSPVWNIALIASRLHLVWIAAVCGKIKTDYRYSNTLGWNTFPIPKLTEQNKADMTRCAEDILLAREAHFPATIADLYDPENMPDDLRRAHERNDEVLERIYIGRRFRNDTERLEKLFELYTKMTAGQGKPKKGINSK
jgi:hypothetical protein